MRSTWCDVGAGGRRCRRQQQSESLIRERRVLSARALHSAGRGRGACAQLPGSARLKPTMAVAPGGGEPPPSSL